MRRKGFRAEKLTENTIYQMPIKLFSIENLQELVNPVKANLKGSCIILSVNYFRLGIPNFTYDNLLSFFFNQIGINQLAIQSYSEFTSRENRCFFRYTTPVAPYLSTLSKQAFKKAPEKRLLSPTHSFIIYRSNKRLTTKIFTSAFGKDSIFSYFLDNNFYWLNLGSKLNETCTFMHHVESQLGDIIEHRSNVWFPVLVYPNSNNKNSVSVNYEYYSSSPHYPKIISDWSSLHNIESVINENFGPSELVSSFNSLSNINAIATRLIKKNPFEFTACLS